MGGSAHIFHSACNNYICIARLYSLSSEHNGLKSGTAYFIYRKRTCFNGKSSIDCRLSGRILAKTRRDHISHDNLFYVLQLNPCPFYSLLYYNGAQLLSRHFLEYVSKLTHSRPYTANENNFFRHTLSPLILC